jgi:3D (Asp-Asp-Asp) domain-containing protein
MNDWENAVVVDPKELNGLRAGRVKLKRRTRALGLLVLALAGLNVATGTTLYGQLLESARLARDAQECRKTAQHASVALTALSKSHENILAATEQAPSVGTKSWGRRFTVTKYLPHSAAYGKFNDGITSTLWKADPKARIVAVDPKLIPYGSWVWIEELGWYRAQDCGAAIKGFRLDLLTASERDAMAFGKQDRFVIVVPPANA